MTVGITLTSGIEAIVIVDSRVSGGGRQSDSVDKIGIISADNYHGTLFGTGNAELINQLIGGVSKLSNDSCEDLLDDLHRIHSETVDGIDKAILNNSKNEINKISSIIVDEKQRQEFVQQQTMSAIADYNKQKSDPLNQTLLVVALYNKKNNKIEQFTLNYCGSREIFLEHVEIGSGADAANLYFSEVLQGKDVKKLSTAELIFYSLNAYNKSTINFGVGGTPRIARISKEDVIVLPTQKTRILTNISGLYLAGHEKLCKRNATLKIMDDIISSKTTEYKTLLGKYLPSFMIEIIGNVYIPLSSWWEAENTKN